MVSLDIERRGVRDQRVLAAMRSVPREEFVEPSLRQRAYDDRPLPIEKGQTISQPYIVARMAEALELQPGERVLEIGTGSGYAAAVLGELADEIFTVERHRALVDAASERLARLGYGRVHVLCGDGTRGLPQNAPFDAIVVTASCPEVPTPLHEQLAVGGRLVIPIGSLTSAQKLVRIRRVDEDGFERDSLASVRFVPLIGFADKCRAPRA